MSRFKYHERSAETVSQRSKQSGGNFDSYVTSNLSFLKVKEGENELRILPPTWDVKSAWGDNWGIEIYVHRGIGPEKAAYLCLDKMREKYGNKVVSTKLGDCPLCAARHDLEDDDEAGQKALKPGKQILAYVINRADEKAGPLVWRLGWQLERDIQIRSQDKKTGGVVALDHPDRGFDISFTREGAGLKTKYVGVDIARDESPLHDKQVRADKWLQFITDNPLSEQLVFFDADHMEQAYMGKKGRKGGNADDEEEDDRPTRTKRKARDDEDEEEEQPRRRSAKADDDDEEEETPRRKRASRDDDDEEEDDRKGRPRAGKPTGDDQDDEDEEDERPARRKARDEEEEDEEQPRRRSKREEPEEEDETPRRKAKRKDDDEDEEDDDDDDDDDRLPTDSEMKRNAAKLKKRPADDEDEDEEDEDDEPAPRARSKKKAAADEDDDEDEDEEDDEPAPKKGKASDKAKESMKRLGSKKK